MILQSHGIIGNQDGSPIVKDYQDTLLVSLSSPVEDPIMNQDGTPGFPGRGFPVPPGPPGGHPQSTWISWSGLQGQPGPLGCGSSGPPGDLGSQGSPGQSFVWLSGSAQDQSIEDMNRSVMQLLASQ